MLELSVSIVRFVDPARPGWVECELVDAHGYSWRFIEKVPVVTTLDLHEQSSYPQRGFIACEELGRSAERVRVTTTRPWGISSVDGTTEFEVNSSELINN